MKDDGAALTDEQIREMVTESLKGRQNAHKRALRKDAEAALRGDRCCREAMAERFNNRDAKWVELPGHLVCAIEAYINTDWKDGRDPSKLGALNAVCYIGEQVAAVYAARKNGASS